MEQDLAILPEGSSPHIDLACAQLQLQILSMEAQRLELELKAERGNLAKARLGNASLRAELAALVNSASNCLIQGELELAA